MKVRDSKAIERVEVGSLTSTGGGVCAFANMKPPASNKLGTVRQNARSLRCPTVRRRKSKLSRNCSGFIMPACSCEFLLQLKCQVHTISRCSDTEAVCSETFSHSHLASGVCRLINIRRMAPGREQLF